jgi:hypothetical protein
MAGTLLALLMLGIQPRVVINEVMAHPASGSILHSPEDRNEFVELYNLSDDTVDLRGWRITDFDATDTIRAWSDTTIRGYAHLRLFTTLMFPHSCAVLLDSDYTSTDTVGGHSQPYHFTDRVLIVRPGNTTIGNGLAGTDPLMLYSLNGDTSTFGTPGDLTDSIPCDAGKGISWERVSPDAPDAESTWFRCTDPAGCTPGRENSATTYCDLACREILCYPLSFAPGVAETIRARVANLGRVAVPDWSVVVFRDLNGNQQEDGEERLGFQTGAELAAGREDTMAFVWQNPEHGIYDIVARVAGRGDQDSSDDRASIHLNLTRQGQSFCLQAEQFGPGLPGYQETLGIAYSLPDSKGNLRVAVYDLNARDRALVYDGKPPAKDGMLYWSGVDRSGRLLPTGIYVVVCEYKSGKDVIFEKKPVVLAKGH